MARWRSLFLLLAASILLAACRVDTAVVLHLNSDGSGRLLLQVRLDKDAVTAAEVDGRSLETSLRLDDLSTAGWHISKWRRTNSGASITAWRSFENPKEVAPIVAEIAGADSSFLRRFKVVHKPGALVDNYSVQIELDPAALKLGLASDAGLIEALRRVGVDPEIVEKNLNARASRDIHFSLKAVLPGGVTADGVSGDGVSSDGAANGARIALSASTKAWHLKAILLLLLGIALVMSAVILLLAGSIRSRRSRHGRHASRHGNHGAHAPAQPSDEVVKRRPRNEHGKHAPRR